VIHLAQIIQENNEFKREINQKYRQFTLFYHKFRDCEIELWQPDRSLPLAEPEREGDTYLN